MTQFKRFSLAALLCHLVAVPLAYSMTGEPAPADLARWMNPFNASPANRPTGHAQGYYQVTPPYLGDRVWAKGYVPSSSADRWGFVAPRFDRRAVAALLDGHAEVFGLSEMQDMRHWCNSADRPEWTLPP